MLAPHSRMPETPVGSRPSVLDLGQPLGLNPNDAEALDLARLLSLMSRAQALSTCEAGPRWALVERALDRGIL